MAKKKSKVCDKCGCELDNYYGIHCPKCTVPEAEKLYNLHEVCCHVEALEGKTGGFGVLYYTIKDGSEISGNDSLVNLDFDDDEDLDEETMDYNEALRRLDKYFPIEECRFYVSW